MSWRTGFEIPLTPGNASSSLEFTDSIRYKVIGFPYYRWPEWIRICEEHKLTRSMSAKGCSPDNAAAEGFFGRLKQEFFHKRSFAGVSMDEFIGMLDDYMVWYRDKRIKTEFGMSIMDRRRELGLVA